MLDKLPTDVSSLYQIIEDIYDLNHPIVHPSPDTQPHIDRAAQIADRFTHLHTQLTQLQQTVSHLNIITLTTDGRITNLTASATNLLKTYFPDDYYPNNLPNQQLPHRINNWLQLQLTDTQTHQATPLIILHNNHDLIINRITIRSIHQLVLIERPAINLTKRSFEPIGLSPRQSEILFYIVQGYENPEIATLLHLHPTTIKTNITNITRKLKASGRLEAVTIGLKKLGIEIMTYVLP